MNWKTSVVSREECSYEVAFVEDCFNPANDRVSRAVQHRQVFCIVDDTVDRIHGAKIREYFRSHGQEPHVFSFVAREGSKTLATAELFMRFCLSRGMGRRDAVLCIGGGVVCDVGGLSAALLRRGVPCVKIPTTLLGMIDGAIGVKTGVNFAGLKNAVGTFTMPACVLIDLALLGTVPASEMGYGLIEMAKIFALKSREDWNSLSENFDSLRDLRPGSPLPGLARNAIRYMLDELEANLYEKDLYRIVDYGHEFGHTIETGTHYALSHGEAVLIGMCLSNAICHSRGLMDGADYESFWRFARNFDLPSLMDRVSPALLVESLRQTHLHKAGAFIVAITEIGKPIYLKSITGEELESAWNACRSLAMSKGWGAGIRPPKALAGGERAA